MIDLNLNHRKTEKNQNLSIEDLDFMKLRAPSNKVPKKSNLFQDTKK